MPGARGAWMAVVVLVAAGAPAAAPGGFVDVTPAHRLVTAFDPGADPGVYETTDGGVSWRRR